MRRIIIDIIEDEKTGRIQVETDLSDSEEAGTKKENMLFMLFRPRILKALQETPGLAGIGMGDTIEECRAKAHLEADIKRAGQQAGE